MISHCLPSLSPDKSGNITLCIISESSEILLSNAATIFSVSGCPAKISIYRLPGHIITLFCSSHILAYYSCPHKRRRKSQVECGTSRNKNFIYIFSCNHYKNLRLPSSQAIKNFAPLSIINKLYSYLISCCISLIM